ncbi:hypothetical protein ASZ78_007041 [Callipepla squamata]|uniref:Schlafen AlbA-2 domain-containing protein n=1 Tax=Callipepla squamata TaxID=9009 RepID=A0A226MQQ3_CALSU|nr:hypothetical protein ASZ78_007041 [Callipepla squamata]
MAHQDNQSRRRVWVDPSTKYPEVVLCTEKIRFGEKARKKMPKDSKQDQKYILASAVCALLNSGGGVVRAEIENKGYSLQRDEIGLDLQDIFRFLLLSPDLTKYLDFEQQDNNLSIFVKAWNSEKTSSVSNSAKPRICSLSSGLYAKSGASLSHMTPTEALLFLEEKQNKARGELSTRTPATKIKTVAVEEHMHIVNSTAAELFSRDQLQYGKTLNFAESGNMEFKHFSTEKLFTRVKEILPQYVAGFANACGGCLWIGVDDNRVVQGFKLSDEGLEELRNRINYVFQNKLNIFHFCKSGCVHKISNYFLCSALLVRPHSLIYTPEKLIKDLFQEHEGLKSLMDEQLKDVSEGVVIFSRSWAVEVGLPENEDILCDILLVAKGMPPILYTVCKRISSRKPENLVNNSCKHHHPLDSFEYSRRTALKLKEKLVNTGGYTHKLCIIPKLLTLPPCFTCGEEWDLDVQKLYPQNYGLINGVNLKNFLHSLIVVLLNFRSFLSDSVGFEFLNLLTVEQYRLLSENLHKTKKLYVYGLPGTGKTVVALKVIEKLRSMFKCNQHEVLYICENQPLRDFVRQKKICRAVTRVAFLSNSYSDVKHIIIDEAQNFRDEAGNWYQKALGLTTSPQLPEPGFLWIFLDYLQTTHCFSTGLPEPRQHDPVESLTKVVRNANSIYCYLKKTMEEIVENPTVGIPQARLQRLLHTASCAHGVEGYFEAVYIEDRNEIAEYVAKHCCQYLKSGYSEKDIAILCYNSEEVAAYSEILTAALRKLNILPGRMSGGLEEYTILDSFRRFSGLERMIVFGIIPYPLPTQHEVLRNMLVSVASRANLNMHLVRECLGHGNGSLYQYC